jgi:rfaE bifunctional protein kinase chain/domain
MLSDDRVEFIMERIPRLTIGVVGDLFLDRYLDIDATLTEKSIETGLDAYQITRVRSYPGAAGTVINNLVALGVKRVIAVSVIGDDGEGYELRQAVERLQVIDSSHVIVSADRRTPTYTKPMLCEPGQPPRELNRLDIKNRSPVPEGLQRQILAAITDAFGQVDALLVMDQVSEDECGVVTAAVRDLLAQLGTGHPQKFMLADSRARIGQFRALCLKPNQQECVRAAFGPSHEPVNSQRGALELARRTGRAVFCTMGDQGILLAEPSGNTASCVPSYPVTGPIDIVGAGDSSSAAIGCAAAAGATLAEAAAFGNLVASITIQQIGTTGTASPQQVRQRWREVRPRG